jgi:hypothetical protein
MPFSMTCLLSTTYFGPVQWYQKLNRYAHCCIEQHDHFVKQTYRNRCVIATTQGPQALTVPVEKYINDVTETKDIRISDHGNWRHLHWNALLSAYGESPFFEFYADDLRPFFERRWTFLLDFNMAINEKVCELLDIAPQLSFTTSYGVPSEGDEAAVKDCHKSIVTDYRDAIRPKHPLLDDSFTPRPYYQVYQQKFGFLPNLSILDLLFNMGNEAVLWL